MAVDFNKWDEEFNAKELEEKAKKASENEFAEIPDGTYIVAVAKMEIGETGAQSKKPGSPMLKVQLKIKDGDFAKQCIFQNFVLVPTTANGDNYGLHRAKEFLRGLDVLESIEFTGFADFNEMILDIMEGIEEDKLAYEIDYKVKNGFGNVEIKDVIEG